MARTVGTLHLLHFDRPFGPPHQQARHYLGFTTRLEERLAYTDIEGSTRRCEERPESMRAAVDRHFALLRDLIGARQGQVFRTQGDGLCAAFATAPQAQARRRLGSACPIGSLFGTQTRARAPTNAELKKAHELAVASSLVEARLTRGSDSSSHYPAV